jgi:magnesium and cobalt exporter, CNNM family
MSGNFHLVLLAVLMILLGALFSGAETGVYRLSRLRLRLAVEKKQWLFVMLGKVMHDSSGLLISLLIGTNLSSYLATSLITRMFLDVVESERAAEVLTTLVTVPILFVFSELIPKNAFFYRADRLTSLAAPLLLVSHRAFTWCGAVPLLRLISQAFTHLIGSPVSSRTVMTSTQSHHVRAILRETHEEGILSPIQSDIVDRIVNIPGLRLNSVMIPLTQVQSVNIRSDRATLLNTLRGHALTRLLVWQDTPANIVGFINIYDVLATDQGFDSLEPFLTPIRQLDTSTPVIDAIDIMRREDLKIVLVMRTRRGSHDDPTGIVTMKDLVEELLGELAEW